MSKFGNIVAKSGVCWHSDCGGMQTLLVTLNLNMLDSSYSDSLNRLIAAITIGSPQLSAPFTESRTANKISFLKVAKSCEISMLLLGMHMLLRFYLMLLVGS
jgi:hypothetical protein